LDLDRFKHINDSRGHETGDKLLKRVAQRIRATVRTEDVVVRMGGDEFIVILKSVRSSGQVNETRRGSTRALSAPIPVDGRPLVTTVSIGVSLYPRDGTDMGELLSIPIPRCTRRKIVAGITSSCSAQPWTVG